jgi:hypothetical protein
MNGNVVFEGKMDGTETNISGIAPGSYLLRVTNQNDQVQTLRVEVLP